MKITIPIRGSDFEDIYENYELFLNEIIQFSHNSKLIALIDCESVPEKNEIPLIEDIEFFLFEGNIHNNDEPKIITELKQKHTFFHTEWINEYLVIDLKHKREKDIPADYFEYLIDDYLTRLNFLINLTYSTNVDFLPGLIYSNSNEYMGRTEIIASSITLAYEHASKIKWPKIKNVTLNDTIDWFYKFEIHPSQRSKNRAHIAINAFSQLFGDLKSSDSSVLFWIMLGIESLLADGIQSISYQIKEKSSIILGKPREYTKKLTKLYNYRSRLIHGDYNISPKFHSDYGTYDEEYADYLFFSTSILIALIRELIATQKDEFKFELTLK